MFEERIYIAGVVLSIQIQNSIDNALIFLYSSFSSKLEVLRLLTTISPKIVSSIID